MILATILLCPFLAGSPCTLERADRAVQIADGFSSDSACMKTAAMILPQIMVDGESFRIVCGARHVYIGGRA